MLKLQKLKQNFMHKHTAENIQLVDSFGSFAPRVFVSRDFPMIPLHPHFPVLAIFNFYYEIDSVL